jgi:UDP-2,3-diacylglucosamine pyrophosphatase LpxH
MRKGVYWPQSHNDVIRTIPGKARHGTRVYDIPGNHDEVFRGYDGIRLENLSIHLECIHTTADGRRLLLLHGDEFDGVVQCSPWLTQLGGRACAFLLCLDRYVNPVRRRFGYRYWSLAAFLKHTVKSAVNYISNFEEVVSRVALAGNHPDVMSTGAH